MKRLALLMALALTACGDDAPIDDVDPGQGQGGGASDEPAPSRQGPMQFDDGLYGVLDLDTVDKAFGLTSVIGMGFRAKPSDAGCFTDSRLPGIRFGCDAAVTKITSRTVAQQGYDGAYCGDDTSTIQDKSYKPCYVPNTAQPSQWKYRVDFDSCVGDIRAGVRKGVNEFNAMMGRIGAEWRFTEVDSGENVTMYCTQGEGFNGVNGPLASAYYYSHVTKSPTVAGNATSQTCNNGGTAVFQNNTKKWYTYLYAAMPLNQDALLNDYGTSGRCWGNKPSGLQGWEWLQINVAGTVIHELGHVIGLNHYSNSLDGIMRTDADCSAHNIFGRTLEARITNAIKRFDTIYEVGSSINAFDANLECIGIRGRSSDLQ